MVYTVTELITRSWYLSGIVSKEEETVSGDQLHDGLNMLNALLSIKTMMQRLIPYYTTYLFTAVIGQEEYFIDDLISAETLTFNIQTVRYTMIRKSRTEYFQTPRANNVISIPFQYHFEREKGGSRLWMYFLPNETYEFTLHGKFSLSDVSLNQDLSLILDQFYIEYLRYALAEYMCQEYNITFQPQSALRLAEFEAQLVDISPIDLTMQKMSCLQGVTSLNYGDINIGKGWRPG
jgi:hypothetical protein